MSKVKSEFLDNFDGKTKKTYNTAINSFIGFLNDIEVKRGKISIETKEMFDKMLNDYLEDKSQNHYENFRNYITYMVENERPPTSIRTYKNGITEFFLQFDIIFTDKEKKNINRKMPKGKKAISREETLTKPILNRLLNNLPIHGKAFLLVASSSGMRIGELLKIRISDIDLEQTPTPIHIRGSTAKNGEPRITFMSPEARLMVIEWLKQRDQYIATPSNLGHVHNVNDDRLFCFSDSVVYKMWNHALQNTNLLKMDENTNRATIRVHGLRKFFRSNLPLNGCPVDVIEEMMGHEGYLTDAYRRLTEGQLSELYNEHQHLLYIGARIDDTSQKAIIEKLELEIRNLKDTMENIKIEKNREPELNNNAENLIIENQQLKEDKNSMMNNIVELMARMEKLESK